MTLIISALSIVKWLGLDYSASQLVFLRALSGLVLMLPWIWQKRDAFSHVDRHGWHLLRIGLSSITLASSFYAVARLPLALFTAINFSRPLVLMVMAALVLGDHIGRLRWFAAFLGLGGVLIAVNPGNVALSSGLLALGITVLAGSAAILVTRHLVDAPAVVLMTFYAAGLSVTTAPFALSGWQTIMPGHLPMLLAIGALTQGAQFCFLRAHAMAGVGLLAPLGYLSLFLSALAGYLVFAETPSLATVFGSVFIVIAAWLAARNGSDQSPR